MLSSVRLLWLRKEDGNLQQLTLTEVQIFQSSRACVLCNPLQLAAFPSPRRAEGAFRYTRWTPGRA